MTTAYYFDYKRGHHGSLSRVGGQPTHLPPEKPWPEADDSYFGFILQIEVDGMRLSIADAAFLQFYQPVDDGDDPKPHVLAVPVTAPRNVEGNVTQSPFVNEWDIDYVRSEDPVTVPDTRSLETAKLFKSKIGGLDPWPREPNTEFLLQVAEGVVGFNFGGAACSVYQDSEGQLIVRMN